MIGAATDGYYAMVGHRDGKGEAEVHAEIDDVFVAREGHAQVIVGGELVSGHETAAGELRGPSIKGGQTYDPLPARCYEFLMAHRTRLFQGTLHIW